MAKEIVVIGCKLPHGLLITDPNNPARKVKINGFHNSPIKGATFSTTPVDAELWATWKAVYSDYEPLKRGAIFEAKTHEEATQKGKDREKVKTGLEPLDPKAHGVEKA